MELPFDLSSPKFDFLMHLWWQILYNYGARKLALIGVGQIGCSPNALAQNSPDGRTCVARINNANQLFNDRLRALVDTLNNQFTDAAFIYVNAYGIFQDLISNPSAFGNFSWHASENFVFVICILEDI